MRVTPAGGGRGKILDDNMTIVPVGQKERDVIVNDSPALISQVERRIGCPQIR